MFQASQRPKLALLREWTQDQASLGQLLTSSGFCRCLGLCFPAQQREGIQGQMGGRALGLDLRDIAFPAEWAGCYPGSICELAP